MTGNAIPVPSRILVPLDGSSLAEVALPVVESLSRSMGAEVVLLHVLESDAPATVHGDQHLQSESAANTYLQRLSQQIQKEGAQTKTVVTHAGNRGVARTIALEGSGTESDLIVLATHGEGGFRDYLFGRVAAQVVNHAEQPLLIVPSEIGNDRYEFRTLVVPLNGTEEAEAVLPTAKMMADVTGAHVELLRVVPTGKTLQGPAAAVRTMLPGATAAMLDLESEDAIGYLNAIAADWFEGNEFGITVRRGQVDQEIVNEAADHNADLVVMATHGRAGFDALLEGSVGHRLLSRGSVPLLLVKAPDS